MSPDTNSSNRQLIMRFHKLSSSKEMSVLKNHKLFISKRRKPSHITTQFRTFLLPYNPKRAKSVFTSEHHFLLLDFTTVSFPLMMLDISES